MFHEIIQKNNQLVREIQNVQKLSTSPALSSAFSPAISSSKQRREKYHRDWKNDFGKEQLTDISSTYFRKSENDHDHDNDNNFYGESSRGGASTPSPSSSGNMNNYNNNENSPDSQNQTNKKRPSSATTTTTTAVTSSISPQRHNVFGSVSPALHLSSQQQQQNQHQQSNENEISPAARRIFSRSTVVKNFTQEVDSRQEQLHAVVKAPASIVVPNRRVATLSISEKRKQAFVASLTKKKVDAAEAQRRIAAREIKDKMKAEEQEQTALMREERANLMTPFLETDLGIQCKLTIPKIEQPPPTSNVIQSRIVMSREGGKRQGILKQTTTSSSTSGTTTAKQKAAAQAARKFH